VEVVSGIVLAHVKASIVEESPAMVKAPATSSATTFAAQWTDISQSGQHGLLALRHVEVVNRGGPGGVKAGNATESAVTGT